LEPVLDVPSRINKFANEFEMFLFYLWCRQDPFAQELGLKS